MRPLLKKSSLDSRIQNNYSSNIPFLDKVLQHVVQQSPGSLGRNTDHLGLLQSRFRPSFETETPLVTLVDDLKRTMNRGSASFLFSGSLSDV